MHVTFWNSLTDTNGRYDPITPEKLREILKKPVITQEKGTLEGWSPAKFTGPRRKENVESLSCVVLDDDSTGFSAKHMNDVWGEYAGLIHTSFSHTDAAPKYRVILYLSRDVTPAEHAILWERVNAHALAQGETLDRSTRDVGRFWFLPGHREGTPYASWELTGQPIDVDEAMAVEEARAEVSRDEMVSLAEVRREFAARKAMAAALGAAWPAKGRHAAQLALAGALRNEGWEQGEALEFLCSVCRAAGDEDRPKRAKTIEHTWGLPEGAPMTSWTRLKASIDPVVVDAARGALGRDAEWTERTQARLVEIAQVKADGLGFAYGGYDIEPPPVEFLVNGLLPRSSVAMLFGRADTLKTWIAFSLGISVASGRPWLAHFDVRKAARVGLVDYETGDSNLRRRLFMLRAGDNKNLGRLSFSRLKPNDPEFWAALERERFELTILDSLRKGNPGADENDAAEAIIPLEHAAEFSERTGCGVLFIHHARKEQGDGWPAFRGSSAIEDQVDVSFAVKKTDVSEERKSVEVLCVKPGDMRTPAPFVIEVSFDDAARLTTLKHVEKKQETQEVAAEDRIRAQVITILRGHPAGILKDDLRNLLKGKAATIRSVLSDLAVSDVIRETRDSGRYSRAVILLNPNDDYET